VSQGNGGLFALVQMFDSRLGFLGEHTGFSDLDRSLLDCSIQTDGFGTMLCEEFPVYSQGNIEIAKEFL